MIGRWYVIAFTYDPTTDRGKVRLTIGDTDTVNADRQIFTDAEIDAFLGMNSSIIKLSSASALEAMAASQVFLLKVMKNMDFQVDGGAVGRELRLQAKQLRKDFEDNGDGTFEGMFGVAEYADTDFSRRERIIKQALRDG